MKTKKKAISMSKLKKRVWATFSRFIRLRDCLITTHTLERGACITCGCVLLFKELQAGHFISGRNNSILFDEECVHAQCKTCNIIKNGNTLVYRRKILELYGDKYDEVLEKRSQQIKKYTIDELLELEKDLKERIKKLEGNTR